MNIQNIPLDNLGVYIADLPVGLFAEIKNDIDNLDSRSKITSSLSAPGTPEHYRLTASTEDNLKWFVRTMIEQYMQVDPYVGSAMMAVRTPHLEFNQPWINLQKENEFVPNHIHEGILSYVVWVQIPEVISFKNPTDVSGHFEFTYSNILGKAIGKTIGLDKTFEGKIMLFPAGLRHCAYPFAGSPDTRISISGNVML
jgi:hypothetical protein